MRIRLIVILSFFFSVASSQIVNKFNDSTWFKRSVQMDSFLRITKGAQYGYFLMSDSIGRGVWNPVGAVSFNAANGLSKSGDTAKFGGEITEDTEVYFNTPDSTHMGITFLPNGVVSLPAPTLVFGERTNDGNVNGIGVVNIPSTLYFTQIGYTDRARGEFSFRPNTGESSIEFEVTRDSDSYIASLKLTPEQLTYGGYVSGDYYLNLDAFMKAYQIGSMNDSTFLSVESENKAAYFIADSGCLIKNLNNDSVRVWVTDSAHIQSNKPLVVNAENGLSIKGANENSGYVLTSDAQGNASWQPSSGGSSIDTTSLSNRIDTKLNESDTASLSARINLKLNSTDTSSLSNRIDLRVPYTGANQDVDLGANNLNAQSISITGTNGNGHIHLKHQASDATATGSSTSLFANSNGYLKWKNDNLYYSTLATPQTANRVFTLQDKSYTLADSAVVSLKLNASDTVSLSSRIDTKLNKSDTVSLSSRIDLKLNKTDTASLSTRIDAKLNKTDTASLSSRINTKLNASDTSSLSSRINVKLNASDTASLSSRINSKLNLSDTASLSTRINTKLNSTDTASLSNRINSKLNQTDTASLSTRINTKLNASDTASLSSRINLKLNATDTASLSTRINLKQTANTGHYLISKTTTGTTVSGTAAETITMSYLVAANTFQSGDNPEIIFSGRKSGANNTGTLKMYINTSNSLSGATQVAQSGAIVSAARTTNFERRFCSFTSSTNLNLISATSGNNSDAVNVSANESDITYDVAQAYYIIISIQLTSSKIGRAHV